MKTYRSRAPVRITFGGGGTDIDPYDKNHGGICLGATINKYVYATLKIRNDKEIRIDSWDYKKSQNFEERNRINYNGELDLLKAVIKKMDPPYGFDLFVRSDVSTSSGLGLSAAASVSTIGLLNHIRKKDRLTNHQIAELAFLIEQEELKNLGGRQDQYASVFGGINLFEFYGDNHVLINPTKAKPDYILELEKNLLIFSTSQRIKTSGEVHKESKEQGLFNNSEKIEQLHKIKKIALEMDYSLREGKLKEFGDLIKYSWELKKSFNPMVTNENIEDLINTALNNGAIGGRLMGAGGGGHLLFYCNSNKEQIVKEKLEEKGVKYINFNFDFRGLETWEVEE